MCGILGIIDFISNNAWDLGAFEKALDLQRHRGPDDQGVFFTDHFVLGHRRLSIIDLNARSRQPMVSADKNYFLVFNGEIYNFQELRSEFIKQGIRFKTESDTEVLLNGLILQGIQFLDKCIGMFAFCFIDVRKQEAYIARDRLGIKPLYFNKSGGKLYFSSTLKSLVEITPEKQSFSTEAFSSYLSFRYPIADRTFFEDVYSLEPGTFMRISQGKETIKEYWNPSELLQEQKHDRGEEYYLSRLKELIYSSVSYRLIADVKVGAYLSGGVDSSGLVATMDMVSDKPINTFTIGFEQDAYNEFDYARSVADQFKTNHIEIMETSKNYYDCMKDLIAYKGAPLSVPNEIPLWALSKELKKYVTVVLSGEGADELFMGYGRIFRSAFDYQRLAGDYEWYSLRNKEKFLSAATKKYGRKPFKNEVSHFLNTYAYTPEDIKYTLLSKDIPLRDYERKFEQEFSRQFTEAGSIEYENKISYTFIKTHLPGLLQRLDNATMAASVEGRVPFLDHRLVEFALTIPVKYKLKWREDSNRSDYEALTSDQISEVHDTPKAILKESFSSVLGDDILHRKKVGFPVPLQKWFQGDFRNVARELLLSQSARERGIYDSEAIEQCLKNPEMEFDRGMAMTIWMLMNNEIFIQQYWSK